MSAFINRAADGRNDLCGGNIAHYRKERGISRRGPADPLQIHGPDVDKNAIRCIEAGKRFITDIKPTALASVLQKDLEELLK